MRACSYRASRYHVYLDMIANNEWDDFTGEMRSTMGFELRAVIGQDAALREWQRSFPSLVVCRLSGDLRLVPLTSKLVVEMQAWYSACETPLQVESAGSQIVWRWLADVSTRARLVFVDAFEFGDMGHEDYTIWADGQPIETTGSSTRVQDYFREQLGIDPGPGFDIGTYRGETAAEKWAATEAVD
jgi:hypothetical protein